MFPECIGHCKGIIYAMVTSYKVRKNIMEDKGEKEILYATLKSRYPFMRKEKGEAMVGKCSNIRELIYKVLEIELIDFNIEKADVIRGKIDAMIEA